MYERTLASEARRLRLDFLFSYQPVPETVIFAGYGNRLLGMTAACGARATASS